MVSLKQQIAGQTYECPLVVSSSPLTDSVELIKRAEDNGASAVSTKLTLLYQAVPGVWANISGFGSDLESWIKIAKAFEQAGADALELNLMCPNMSGEKSTDAARPGGGIVGKDPGMVEQIVRALKASVKTPIWCKPATEVLDYSLTVKAVRDGGADGMISSATPLVAPPIDIFRGGRPKVGTTTMCSFGGLQGPAIRPASYRLIATAARVAPGLPIAGGGGIEKWEHAIEAIMWGASLVCMCTKLLWDGFGVLKDVRQGMLRYMEKYGYESIGQMRGQALQYLVTNDRIAYEPSYAVVDHDKCGGCGMCERIGSCTAITLRDKKAYVEKERCCGCALCGCMCPSRAISYAPVASSAG
jgi:dihydropyrimidine dehydrogenase (NAD+) subunit PreA